MLQNHFHIPPLDNHEPIRRLEHPCKISPYVPINIRSSYLISSILKIKDFPTLVCLKLLNQPLNPIKSHQLYITSKFIGSSFSPPK